MAEHLSGTSGLRFSFRGIVLTPGAMAALNLALRAVREQGAGEVIVPVPCWLDYPLHLENLGLVARLVPVDPATLRLDLAAIAAALSPRTVALLLMQPSNPSGLLHSEAELRALADLLDEVSASVESFIRARFRVSIDDSRFSRQSNPWEDGYVDSIGAVELIGFIEATFGVALPDEALFDTHFTSVNGIAAIVSRLPTRRAD